MRLKREGVVGGGGVKESVFHFTCRVDRIRNIPANYHCLGVNLTFLDQI